jgi:hypothetical protein
MQDKCKDPGGSRRAARTIARHAKVAKFVKVAKSAKVAKKAKVAQVAKFAKVAKVAKVAKKAKVAKVAKKAKVAQVAEEAKLEGLAALAQIAEIAEQAEDANESKESDEAKSAKIVLQSKSAEGGYTMNGKLVEVIVTSADKVETLNGIVCSYNSRTRRHTILYGSFKNKDDATKFLDKVIAAEDAGKSHKGEWSAPVSLLALLNSDSLTFK